MTGVTLEYLIGSLCDWKLCAWISSTVPVFSILTCLLLPESPSWLITSGKKQKCFNSLKKLRGSTCDVQREVNTLIEFSERNHSRTANAKEKGLLCHSSVIKPFFILTTYFFIYQMSGSSTLTFYVVTIFEVSILMFKKTAIQIVLLNHCSVAKVKVCSLFFYRISERLKINILSRYW